MISISWVFGTLGVAGATVERLWVCPIHLGASVWLEAWGHGELAHVAGGLGFLPPGFLSTC